MALGLEVAGSLLPLACHTHEAQGELRTALLELLCFGEARWHGRGEVAERQTVEADLAGLLPAQGALLLAGLLELVAADCCSLGRWACHHTVEEGPGHTSSPGWLLLSIDQLTLRWTPGLESTDTEKPTMGDCR